MQYLYVCIMKGILSDRLIIGLYSYRNDRFLFREPEVQAPFHRGTNPVVFFVVVMRKLTAALHTNRSPYRA